MRIFINFTNMVYYAVGKGRCPGIYLTWEECKKQVHQFTGAKYHKFSTLEEANQFIKTSSSSMLNGKSTKKFLPGDRSEISGISENLAVVVSNSSDSHITEKSDDKCLDVISIEKRLALFEKKYEEATRNIQAELGALKESVSSLESRLGIVEKKLQVDIVTLNQNLPSTVTHVNEVKKIFDEEFGHIKEKIKSYEGQKSKMLTEEEIPHRRILKEFLSKETTPIPLNSRGTKSGKSLQTAKRKYSTESTDTVIFQPAKTAKLEDKLTCSQTPFIVNSDGYVEVYTDGACEKNGKRGARAGVGVWFGDNHPLNVSEPVIGRATNNMAEIQAATYAVETAKKAGIKKLLVHTDSNFLINCITDWIKKWKRNGWRVGGGEPVKNKEELIVLDNKLQGIDVKWNHVRGHRGIHGNEMADQLAREGAKRYVEIKCNEDFGDDF